MFQRRSAISVSDHESGRSNNRESSPVLWIPRRVVAQGESAETLPEGGTFFDTNMRKQIENTTGKPLRVTIRRENGTFFAHLLLRPPVAARFRRLARKAGVSLEAALQLSIEQAARHFAA